MAVTSVVTCRTARRTATPALFRERSITPLTRAIVAATVPSPIAGGGPVRAVALTGTVGGARPVALVATAVPA